MDPKRIRATIPSAATDRSPLPFPLSNARHSISQSNFPVHAVDHGPRLRTAYTTSLSLAALRLNVAGAIHPGQGCFDSPDRVDPSCFFVPIVVVPGEHGRVAVRREEKEKKKHFHISLLSLRPAKASPVEQPANSPGTSSSSNINTKIVGARAGAPPIRHRQGNLFLNSFLSDQVNFFIRTF